MYITNDLCVYEKKTLFSSAFHSKWTFKMTDEPISFDKWMDDSFIEKQYITRYKLVQ